MLNTKNIIFFTSSAERSYFTVVLKWEEQYMID